MQRDIAASVRRFIVHLKDGPDALNGLRVPNLSASNPRALRKALIC
jgi:hypothetical protein